MTSKNLLCSTHLIRQNLKRFAWVIALFSAIFLFAFPFAAAITCQDAEYMLQTHEELVKSDVSYNGYILEIVKDSINGLFSTQYSVVIFLAFPCAITAAAVIFNYLNSKKQVDFFHSLPISRTALFVSGLITCITAYCVPFITAAFLALAVAAIFGFWSFISLGSFMSLILLSILAYVVTLAIVLTALMLCGNTVVGILGTAVFFVYPIAISGLYIFYLNIIFESIYSTIYYRLYEVYIIRNICPICDFVSFSNDFSPVRIISYVIISAVLIGISLLLYKKRESEAAGKAIAFRLAKPIIKYSLMLVFSLALGGIFSELIRIHSTAWMIFGIILGAFLANSVIEIIYEFDFNAMFRGIKSFLIFTPILLVVLGTAYLDPLGYDNYMPNPKKVSSVSLIDLSVLSYNAYNNFSRYNYNNFLVSSDKQIINASCSLVSLSDKVSDTQEMSTAAFGFKDSIFGTKYRKYNVPEDDLTNYLYGLFDNIEFKKKYFKFIDEYNDIIQRDDLTIRLRNIAEQSTDFSADDFSKSFISIMRSETLSLDSDYVKNNYPVFAADIGYYNRDKYFVKIATIPVYEKSTQAIELLSEHFDNVQITIDVEKIDSITVYPLSDYRYIYNTAPTASSEVYYDELKNTDYELSETESKKSITITDTNQIAQILDSCTPTDSHYGILFNNFDDSLEVVLHSNKNSSLDGTLLYFEKGNVPEFIYDLLDINQ